LNPFDLINPNQSIKMNALKQKTKSVAAKLGDHPNVSEDPNVNPTSGIGIGANDGHGMSPA